MFVPDAKSVPRGDDRDRIRQVVHDRGLVGLANDTKWNALIDTMRARRRRLPSYRVKRVDGPVSGWDTEWVYHLPFPMLSVEWLDISLVTEQRAGQLIPPARTDHSDWILPLLDRIGFDTLQHGDIVRVFGYGPHDLEGLDASDAA